MTAYLPAICTAIFLTYLPLPVIPPTLPQPCSTVRQTVDLLGMDGAMALAARQGWTAQQIAEARRLCLSPGAPTK